MSLVSTNTRTHRLNDQRAPSTLFPANRSPRLRCAALRFALASALLVAQYSAKDALTKRTTDTRPPLKITTVRPTHYRLYRVTNSVPKEGKQST